MIMPQRCYISTVCVLTRDNGVMRTHATEPTVGLMGDEREAAHRRRAEIAERHLRPASERATSSARGVHHVALLSNDVERTVEFYQGLLESPLTEMFEN